MNGAGGILTYNLPTWAVDLHPHLSLSLGSLVLIDSCYLEGPLSGPPHPW